MAGKLTTNYDTTKIFLGANKSFRATYTNGTGGEVTLNPGRVFGRVVANNKVAPQDKDNVDGTEQGRFVLMSSHVVANGADAVVTVCYAGEVDANTLVWGASETLATPISRTYTDSGAATVVIPIGTNHDILVANSQLQLVMDATELTKI